jgi:hypothetical protein
VPHRLAWTRRSWTARLDNESGYTGDRGKPVFGEVPKIESDFPVTLSEREDRNGNGTPRSYLTAPQLPSVTAARHRFMYSSDCVAIVSAPGE